jgi:hypothetical protein
MLSGKNPKQFTKDKLFEPGRDGDRLKGTTSDRSRTELTNKPVPTTPRNVLFEIPNTVYQSVRAGVAREEEQ